MTVSRAASNSMRSKAIQQHSPRPLSRPLSIPWVSDFRERDDDSDAYRFEILERLQQLEELLRPCVVPVVGANRRE